MLLPDLPPDEWALHRDLAQFRDRLTWELTNCGSRDCPVHERDWAVLATVQELLGVARTEPVPRRAWWEE